MTTKTKKARQATVRNNTLEQLNGQSLKLLGEVVTFRAPGPHAYASVKQALQDSGLDQKVLRERLPRHAFTRACKELEEGRVIDILRDDTDEMLFQFSKRHMTSDVDEGEEFEYKRELKLVLNKTSGKVEARKTGKESEAKLAAKVEMEQRAQKLLDEHMTRWSTSDVHGLACRLFRQNADLMPLPDTEGVYFVPMTQQPFVSQVADFMTRLGGRVNRLPVPEGTQTGDLTVQQCVGEYLDSLVKDHDQAVQGLTLSSRPTTIQEQADRINQTRIKVEAYASYLAERKDELLRHVEEAKDKLQAKVLALAGDRKAAERLEVLAGQPEGSPWQKVFDALTGESQDIFQLCEAAGLGTPSLVLYQHLDRMMAGAMGRGFIQVDEEEGGFYRPQQPS